MSAKIAEIGRSRQCMKTCYCFKFQHSSDRDHGCPILSEDTKVSSSSTKRCCWTSWHLLNKRIRQTCFWSFITCRQTCNISQRVSGKLVTFPNVYRFPEWTVSGFGRLRRPENFCILVPVCLISKGKSHQIELRTLKIFLPAAQNGHPILWIFVARKAREKWDFDAL